MDGQSMTRRDFKWPFPKPITFKPAQPPLEIKPSSFYMYRFVPAYCHCDTHQYDAEMNQYQALAKREAILVEDLTAVQNKMTELSNGILDHPCDDDDTKLQTIYQTDYAKRKFKVPEYRKFMADLDSKVGDPIKPPSIGLSQGYRDPTSFRYTAIIRPTIETPPAPSFAVSEYIIIYLI